MAGNPIASLFAELGFRYNDAKLKKFKSDLEGTAKQINSSSKKSVGGATKEADKKQDAFAKRIKQTYTSKVKPAFHQMKDDLRDIDKAFQQSRISHEDYQKHRARIVEEIGKVEKQQAAAHQRALNEVASKERTLSNQRESANKKRLNENFRINKQFDSRSAKLKQMRADFAHMNREYKAGNITLKERERILKGIVAQRARLMGPDPEPGPYAGGKDPRQAGNHRLISAIHSDVGLGAIAGGFAIAQSSRVYQEFVGVQQGLNAAMGDIQKGGKELEWLIQTSNKLGISINAAADGYKGFAAATKGTTLAGDQTREVFEAVSSYAKVLNLSADDTKGVFRSLTQMVSKGRVNAEELSQQFGERLPGGFQAAARAMGMTTGELRKATENGEILAEDLLPGLVKELMIMANSGDQLEKAMDNTNSALNRFSNNVILANARMNEAGLDKGIRNIFNTMSEAIMRATPVWETLGKLLNVVFSALEGPIEFFGMLGEKLGLAMNDAGEFTTEFKALTAAIIYAVKPFRKIAAALFLMGLFIPAITDTLDEGFDSWSDFFTKMAVWAAGVWMLTKALGPLYRAGKKVKDFFGGGKGGSTNPAPDQAGGDRGGKRRGRFAALTAVRRVLGLGVYAATRSEELGGGRDFFAGPKDRPEVFVFSPEEWEQKNRERQSNALQPLLGPGGGLREGELPFGRVMMQGDVNITIDGDSPTIRQDVIEVITDIFRDTSVQEPSAEK